MSIKLLLIQEQNVNYKELLITIGLMIGLTLLYVGLRKFIAWAIEDKDKWLKKNGKWGYTKESKETNQKLAYHKLTGGYMMIMGLLVAYLIKLFMDMQ